MPMSSLAMETHEFIKELTEAGLTEHQSEVIARHQSLIISENLATKHDIELLKQNIESLRQELKQDIESSRQELKQDIESVKQDFKQSQQELIIKLGMIFIGGWVATIGIILGGMSVMLK